MTGVGVYPPAASIIVSMPLAAKTSKAVANAGSDNACVSMPTNNGPSIPARCRQRQTACAIARICASLNAQSKAQPRWPEVPKDTRGVGIAGTGTAAKEAVSNRDTLTRGDAGASFPASGLVWAVNLLRLSSQYDCHAMACAIVGHRDQCGCSRQHLSVEFDRENAAGDSQRILDADIVACAAAAERDFVAGPRLGNTGIDEQIAALQSETEDALKRHAINPPRRSAVPSPTPASNMWRHRIDVGTDDIGFHLITVNTCRVIGVINR